MKNIKIKHFDALLDVIKSYVISLRYEGFGREELVFVDNVHESVEIKSLVEWFALHMNSLLLGGEFIVATMDRIPDGENTTWCGESIKLITTPLNSGNLLVELVYYGIDQDESGFLYNDEGSLVKVYVCETSHMPKKRRK